MVAALLGAEEYRVPGAAALVAIGCDMARQATSTRAPPASRRSCDDLRAKFTGTPDQVVAFFIALAEDVRRELAALGFRRAWPRRSGGPTASPSPRTPRSTSGRVDASRLPGDRAAGTAGRLADAPAASPLDERLALAMAPAMASLASRDATAPVVLSAALTTAERTVGARISATWSAPTTCGPAVSTSATCRSGATIVDLVHGAAGQSLGAFVTDGVRVAVGAGSPTTTWRRASRVAPSWCAAHVGRAGGDRREHRVYGATGGRLHLVGRAGCASHAGGERGRGGDRGPRLRVHDRRHGGRPGPDRFFGAGMTGGRAHLYDPDGRASPSRDPAGPAPRRRRPARSWPRGPGDRDAGR